MRFKEVLGEKLAVRSNSLVKILLLLQAVLRLNVFLLQACDQVIFEFYLLQRLIIVLVGFASLHTVLVSVRFKHPHVFLELFQLVFKPEKLHLQLHLLIFKRLVLTFAVSLGFLRLHILLVKNLFLPDFIFDFLLLVHQPELLGLSDVLIHFQGLERVFLGPLAEFELRQHLIHPLGQLLELFGFLPLISLRHIFIMSALLIFTNEVGILVFELGFVDSFLAEPVIPVFQLLFVLRVPLSQLFQLLFFQF